MAKIKKEQLAKIKKQQSDLSDIITSIGVLEIQKHEALHNQAVLSQEIEQTKKELEDEYGAININLADGSYESIKDDGEHAVVKSEE